LGQAEKTDFDASFEMLLDRAEKTKNWTEKIMKQTETVLTPNPSELNTFAIDSFDDYNAVKRLCWILSGPPG